MSETSDRFIVGPPRYSFAARPLTAEEFMAISRMLMKCVRKDVQVSGLRRFFGLLPFLILGGLGGFLVAHYKFSTALIISIGDNPPVTSYLDDFQFELLLLAAIAVGIIVQLLATLHYQKKFFAIALKRSKTYALPQAVALTDNAIVATCTLGVISCAWSRLTHRYQYNDLQVLVFDQAFLIWLPQADITAQEGAAAFLDQKSGITLQ